MWQSDHSANHSLTPVWLCRHAERHGEANLGVHLKEYSILKHCLCDEYIQL
jgi:hypothetical protein